MSKKILKRSLALDALMAFVIIGQAWAAEPVLETVTITDNIIYLNDGGNYNLGEEAKVVLTTKAENTIAKNANITVNQGQTLEFVSDASGSDWNGVVCGNVSINEVGKNYGEIIVTNNVNGNALLSVSGVADVVKMYANKITVDAKEHNAMYVEANDDLVLDAKTIILKSGADGDGMYASGGKITITGFETLDINKEKTTDGYGIANQGGTIIINGGTVNVTSSERGAIANYLANGTTSIIANKLNVVSAIGEDKESRKNSVIYVGQGSLVLDIKENITIENTSDNGYAILAEEDAVLSGMTLDGGNSYVKGAIGTNSNSPIGLSNGAYWQNTGDSNVAMLTLNKGVIQQTSSGNKITVGTLSGEGTLQVGDATPDQMVVKTKGGGYALKVATNNQDTELANLSKVAKMDNGDESAVTTVAITGGSVYDEISAEVTGYGTISDKVNKTVASANISAKDMAALGLMSWRAEMNDMNKRMGELRNANGEHGVWVRMVRGEDEYKSVKSQYNQYQLGYDEKLSVDKRWTVGMALSYTDGETSFAKGSGENTNKALSIYGSKLNDDGTFVDLIAKYARLENDFKSYSGMEDADYSTNGYSVSAEFGKRIQQGKGLWIEPQVELTYGKVSAVDYLSKAGVKVAQDGMESLIGRVGFSLGKDIKQGNVYARASYLYDFDGETAVTLDGQEKLEQDLGGGWWEVGVGANINLSKATYIYADVEKTFGGEVDTNWQWNLGVRYSF
ncbi:MAG: autotransporter outer membrane beta-barrel domain-containing protein [Phascolarctobacterium sp.]|nr:autotransporter outer membrane beta-barrel domain-containing protein [Phascolarctobacterium sp.]